MKTIIQHNGHYNIYDSISDGFIYESSLTLEQLIEYIRLNNGQKGVDALPERLERAQKKGHSSHDQETLEEFLCCNRAGENESYLEIKEIIERFLS